MRFGVCADITMALPLKEAGFDFLELHVQNHLVPGEGPVIFSEQLQKIRNLELPSIAANRFIPAGLKICGAGADLPKLKQFVSVVCGRAREAGIKIIVFASGAARRIPEGFNKSKAWEQLVAFGAEAAAIAQVNGCTIVLEPLCARDTNTVLSVFEGAALVRAVGHASFKLMVDSYHWHSQNDTVESILENGDIIDHVHIGTYAKRLAPGLEQCDFTVFVKALRSIKYDKGISIEAGWNNMALEASLVLAQVKRDFGV